jgi:hypothetical protein
MVWEGVLKAELDFLLGRYDNDFREGNYQKYGQVPPRSSLNKTVNKSLIVLKKGPVCNYKWDLYVYFEINRT